MILEMVKSEGISHNSYVIGSKGELAVIDPRRDVDIYLELSRKYDSAIRYIFETHRNEDYTVGSLELASRVDAEILHGQHMDFEYGTEVIEGDIFDLGSIEMEVKETPGHTMESITLVVRDKDISNDAYLVFTGDVIFAGEVGRVDFFGESKTPSMAELLYDSIHQKILPLGDNVLIYPAHGAGSVCGADIREQEFTTIGYEKKTNPLLQLKKEEFIQHKVEEKLYTPPYFSKMEENNQKGAPLLGCLPESNPLNPEELVDLMKNEVQVVDIRKPTSFGGGHIPGTLNIWKEGFPAYSGYFLNYEDPLVIIDDNEGHIPEVVRYLVRLGYDNIYGHLSGGFHSWYMAAQMVGQLDMWSVHHLKDVMDKEEDIFLLDVRKVNDYEKFRIAGSHHIWVGDLPHKINEVPRDKKVVVYCDSGYKSTIACSILKINGYDDVSSVLGSMGAWLNASYPVIK